MPLTFTTNLPDASGLLLDSSIEDEVTANWDDTVNYGSYHVQHKASDVTTWTDDGTVGEATLSMTVGNLNDGEEYDLRVRTETEHATGAWISATTITVLPKPTNLSADAVRDDAVDLSWTDTVDNEDGYRIERADEKDNTRPTGFDPFAVIDTIGPDTDPDPSTTTYTDTGLKSNWAYRYRTVVFTEHAEAASGELETTTAVFYPTGEWLLELRRSDGEITTVGGGDIIAESITPEVSAIGRWEVTIPDSTYVSEWLRADAYLWYDQTLLLRGELVEARSPADGTMMLSGPDIMASLEEGGEAVTYSSARVDAAIRDYLATYTSVSATVYDQQADTVDTNLTVQNE